MTWPQGACQLLTCPANVWGTELDLCGLGWGDGAETRTVCDALAAALCDPDMHVSSYLRRG